MSNPSFTSLKSSLLSGNPNKASHAKMLLRKLFFSRNTIDKSRVRAGLNNIWSDKYTKEGEDVTKLPLNITDIESTKITRPKPYIGPFKEFSKSKEIYKAIPRVSEGLLDTLQMAYDKENQAKQDSIDNNSVIHNNKTIAENTKNLRLTSGRYNLAKVSPALISNLVLAAKRQGINPNLMIALAGRESTFDSNRTAVKHGTLAGHSTKKINAISNMFGVDTKENEMRNIVSGWTVQNPYMPQSPANFLADKKVPGIDTFTNKLGVTSYVNNEATVNAYLKDHPKIMSQYMSAMKKTKDVKNLNPFDMAARRLADKGLTSYNPGDKQYSDKLREDHATLSKDPAMSSYLKTLGVDPNKKFRSGGILY
jgi:hypothetical protein